MINESFKQHLGPSIEEIRDNKLDKVSSSLRPLAQILIEWYDRIINEEELNHESNCSE